MEIKQVKEDIKKGISKRVYYSTDSLWWTHLDSDVEEATEQGKECLKKDIEDKLQNNRIPEAQKTLMKANLVRIDDSPTPLDPYGAPLYQIDPPSIWVDQAEKNPEHFGKHKTQALMKMHHQNCNGQLFRNWKDINEFIDNINVKEKIK